MKVKKPFTKLAVDARKTVGLTQEEAAELLGVSIATLQRYEADDARIHDDIADRMAMIYHDPRLRRLYCEHECTIGGQNGHCESERSTSDLLLALMLIRREEVEDVVRTLQQILSDGVIDDTEMDAADRCTAFLDRMEKNAAALKLQARQAREKA